jgi:hypothetical protein
MRHSFALFSVAMLAFAVMGLSPTTSSADTDVDLRAGYYSDMSAVSLGGGLLAGMGSSWFFNPNLELAFGDRGTMTALSGDFHYDLASGGNPSPYLGLGPTVRFANPDRGSSNTHFGLNLLGGVVGLYGVVRPFAQIKAVIADKGNSTDRSEVAFMGGIRF